MKLAFIIAIVVTIVVMVPSVFADYPNDCFINYPYLWSDNKCRTLQESDLKNMCPSTGPYRWSDNYCYTLQESDLKNGCSSSNPYRWSDNKCHTLQESDLKNGCSSSNPYLWSDNKCHTLQESDLRNHLSILIPVIFTISAIVGILYFLLKPEKESGLSQNKKPYDDNKKLHPTSTLSPPVPSSPTSENVLKSEDLVDHKQTSDDQINKNCSLCKVSFPSSQAMLQHTIEKHSLVNIKWQVVFLFMPFVSIWAFYRIKKLGKGLLLALGLDSLFFGIIFLMLMVASVSNNENGILVSNVVFFIGVMFVWLGMIWLRIHYMLKWSRQWNKKRDIQIESLSNEPKQD